MIKSRWVSLLVWVAVVPFAAWAVLRIGGWTPVWQWIALVAFTPYVAAASAVALLLALGLRRWGAAADATGNGLTATWPQQGWKSVPGVTIDQVLADSRMAITAFGVHALPDTDHRPVFAELGLPRLAGR